MIWDVIFWTCLAVLCFQHDLRRWDEKRRLRAAERRRLVESIEVVESTPYGTISVVRLTPEAKAGLCTRGARIKLPTCSGEGRS